MSHHRACCCDGGGGGGGDPVYDLCEDLRDDGSLATSYTFEWTWSLIYDDVDTGPEPDEDIRITLSGSITAVVTFDLCGPSDFCQWVSGAVSAMSGTVSELIENLTTGTTILDCGGDLPGDYDSATPGDISFTLTCTSDSFPGTTPTFFTFDGDLGFVTWDDGRTSCESQRRVYFTFDENMPGDFEPLGLYRVGPGEFTVQEDGTTGTSFTVQDLIDGTAGARTLVGFSASLEVT